MFSCGKNRGLLEASFRDLFAQAVAALLSEPVLAAIVALGVIGSGIGYLIHRKRSARFAILELRRISAWLVPLLARVSGYWNPGDDGRLRESDADTTIGKLAEDCSRGDKKAARTAAEALHEYNRLSRAADSAQSKEERGSKRRQAQEAADVARQALARFM
jgi:hypothetical protein